jgi:hypothetical protein
MLWWCSYSSAECMCSIHEYILLVFHRWYVDMYLLLYLVRW